MPGCLSFHVILGLPQADVEAHRIESHRCRISRISCLEYFLQWVPHASGFPSFASEHCFWNPSLFFSFFITFHILSFPPLPFSVFLCLSLAHTKVHISRENFPMMTDVTIVFLLSFAMCSHLYYIFNYYNPTQRPVFFSLLRQVKEISEICPVEELRIKTGHSFIDLINEYLLHTTLYQKLCQALGTQY